MYDHLSLLQLYSEWGIDENLTSVSINHLENRKPIPTLPLPKKQSVSTKIITKTNQYSAFQSNSLQEINQAILEFKDCSLKNTAMNTILSVGDPKSHIYIIGDVPDADEDRSGRVFADTGNFWLEQMLDNIDISLDACFRIPLVPWRPPGGRQISTNELELCLPFLYKLLILYQPRYILTIGQLPAKTLLKTPVNFNQLKNQWHSFTYSGIPNPIQLFPLHHLSQININAKIRQVTWKNLLYIRATIDKNT